MGEIGGTYHFGGCPGGVDESRADEVGDTGGRGDRHGEGDLVRDGSQGGEHALRGEILGAKPAGEECHDLEGKPLSLNHDHSRQGQTDHDPPVGQGTAAETPPALTAIDEAHVQEEQDGQECVRECDGDRCANEAQLKTPDEQPEQQGVERRRNEEDISSSPEEALGLREALPALEEDDAGDAEDHDAQVETSQAGRVRLGDDAEEDAGGEVPQHGDGDHEGEEEEGHALELDSDEVLVAGSVGLRAEGVEAGG
jgi:hypothetical protein